MEIALFISFVGAMIVFMTESRHNSAAMPMGLWTGVCFALPLAGPILWYFIRYPQIKDMPVG